MKCIKKNACRKLQASAKVARFCSEKHRDLAMCHEQARKPYGPREALSREHVLYLFELMCLKLGSAWAAVMLLLSVVTGERVDAVRQMQTTWISGLGPRAIGKPVISWPAVNRKTKQRESVLDTGVAGLLWQWLAEKPLQGKGNSVWPCAEQDLKSHMDAGTAAYLFPARVRGGHNARNLQAAVSGRAYNYVWQAAQRILKQEIAQAHRDGRSHSFEEVDLKRLSSHCGKKSFVNIVDNINIASTITGTTASVLQNCYVAQARPAEQRRVLSSALGDVVDSLDRAASPSHCTSCGLQSQADWQFCAGCGKRLQRNPSC